MANKTVPQLALETLVLADLIRIFGVAENFFTVITKTIAAT
jgi:hypothetical protein